MTCITAARLSLARDGAEPPPDRWLSLTEIPRALAALIRLPFNARRLARMPRGKGDRVLVIPGFGAGDGSTAILRAYLRFLGYDVHGWGLGRNLGARTIGVHNERLIDRFDALRKDGREVHIIGWSMGGIMARMLARVRPEGVAQLVLLAAPFAGNPYANRAWQLYERISGHSLSHPVARAQIRQSKLPPPVPSTSLYSKTDGVVSWTCCLEPEVSHCRNIEVNSAHCAFGIDADILAHVAHVLACPPPSKDVK